MMTMDRREFLRILGLGGVAVFCGVEGLARAAGEAGTAEGGKGGAAPGEEFFFIQLSDTHIGFKDPAVNPDFAGTLKKAIAAINALAVQPEFIVFTGDLTHGTTDPDERRRSLTMFREIAGGLTVKDVFFLPGEHDAAFDVGAVYQEVMGATRWSFARKGVRFIGLDNVSDAATRVGEAQIEWLKGELAPLDKDQRIVVFTHRPLFDLYPSWDWATRDGAAVVDLLMLHRDVTVFYGHIHQEHHHMTGHIAHHAGKGMMYPLPAPGSVPKKAPVPWDPAAPYKGLGYRSVRNGAEWVLVEQPLGAGM